HVALVVKDLGHADFLSENSVHHFSLSSSSLRWRDCRPSVPQRHPCRTSVKHQDCRETNPPVFSGPVISKHPNRVEHKECDQPQHERPIESVLVATLRTSLHSSPLLFSRRLAPCGYLCAFPTSSISTPTPAGRSSFISASTVFCVGSRMSISRLCVRTSNASRDFLSTWGERSTQYLFFTVGNGIGPAICAPVRLAVSTISPVDWSRMR